MIIYSRFSTNRNKSFRLSTVIKQSGTTRSVMKSALNSESTEHIAKFQITHDYLKGFKLPFEISDVTIKDSVAHFPFIQGSTLFSKVVNYVVSEDYENAVKTIDFYIDKIVKKGLKSTRKKPTDELKQVLGDSVVKFSRFVEPGIVDLNLDNLIETKSGKLFLIDYEWVWQSTVPEDYIIFKAITSLLNALIQMRLKIDVLLDSYGKYITKECIELEYCFQNYVVNESISKSEFNTTYRNILKYEPKSMYSHYELFDAQTKRLEFLEKENSELKGMVSNLQMELSSAKRTLSRPGVRAIVKAANATRKLKKLIY